MVTDRAGLRKRPGRDCEGCRARDSEHWAGDNAAAIRQKLREVAGPLLCHLLQGNSSHCLLLHSWSAWACISLHAQVQLAACRLASSVAAVVGPALLPAPSSMAAQSGGGRGHQRKAPATAGQGASPWLLQHGSPLSVADHAFQRLCGLLLESSDSLRVAALECLRGARLKALACALVPWSALSGCLGERSDYSIPPCTASDHIDWMPLHKRSPCWACCRSRPMEQSSHACKLLLQLPIACASPYWQLVLLPCCPPMCIRLQASQAAAAYASRSRQPPRRPL